MGLLLASATLVGAWGATNWWLATPFLVCSAFMIARPWALGVYGGGGEVQIKSWFRTYRLRAVDVAAVNIVKYSGLLGFAVGWIPFVGRVAMLEVETPDGGYKWLPATFNRRNRVLRIAREVREALGLRP